MLLQELKRELLAHPKFTALWQGMQKGHIQLPNGLNFISLLLQEFHTTPTSGHIRITKALERLQKCFTWCNIKNNVRQFIAQCLDCQHTKYEPKKFVGLLDPLPIPAKPWEDLFLDFIVGIPPFWGHTMILVVVDIFSKGIHLGMLPSHYITYTVTPLFLDIIAKHHGMPKSLVFDQDPLFISKFWQKLFKLSDTKLCMSSAYHPQSDGQTEVLNRIMQQYLLAFVHNKPSTWGKFLPWVEWSYNTSRNSITGTSLFEVTFGKKPPTFLQYIAGSSSIEAVDTILTNREAMFENLCMKLFKVTRMNETLCR